MKPLSPPIRFGSMNPLNTKTQSAKLPAGNRALFAAVFFLLVCSSAMFASVKVLAIVNDDSITTGMMEEELARIHMRQFGDVNRADFSVDRLLQKLINNRLIVQEAHAIGLSENETIVQMVARYRENLAYKSLLRELSTDTASFSDAELRSAYDDLYRSYHLRLVCVTDSILSAAIADSIRAGAPMNELAQRHSVDKFKDNGGDGGWYESFNLPPDLLKRANSSSVGDLLGPMFLWRVWTLVRIEEIQEADPAQFDSIRAALTEVVRARRIEDFKQSFTDSLIRTIPVIVDSIAVDSVIIQMQTGLSGTTLPVVTVGKDRFLTSADLRNKYIHRIAGRKDREARAVLYEVLLENIQTMLFKEAAAQSDFISQPRFDDETNAYEDSILITAYLEDVIAPSVEVSMDEISEYYQNYSDQFREAGRVRIATLTRETEEEATADYQTLQSGTDFDWLVRKNSTDEWKARAGLRDWMSLAEFPPMMRSMLDTASIATVLPPVKTDQGVVIMKLVDRQPGQVLPLDQVETRIRANLQQRKQLEAIDKAIQTLRADSDIRIFDEALNEARVTGPAEE